MKKKRTTFYLILVVAIIGVAWIVFNRDERVQLSRIQPVLDYEAEDIGAMAFVFYDVIYKGDADFVKNIELKLMVGDKKLVKRHFNVKGVPLEPDNSYIDKTYNAFIDIKDHKGPEDGISSLDETGLVFFTKDGKMFLAEFIDRSRATDGPDKERVWIAKVSSRELAPVFAELLDKYGL